MLCSSFLVGLYGAVSDITKAHNFPQEIPDSLALIIIPLFFPQLSLCLLCRTCVVHVSVGSQFYNSTIRSAVVFCNNFLVLQKEGSLMRGEDYAYMRV